MNLFDMLANELDQALITDDRWKSMLSGLGNTIIITIFAILLGILIGLIVAVVRVSAANAKGKPVKSKLSHYVLMFFDKICGIYLSIIRGTPIVVQLMIMYFGVFAAWQNGIPVAIITFGINSGAYVAEIFRAGILSIDKGQMEAGRSLGLPYTKTMGLIVLPQAIKNILPSLVNEFIALFKETSVVGYVSIIDLTMAANLIRSRTYQPFTPMIITAIIYWICVTILTQLMKILERRLAKSDNR